MICEKFGEEIKHCQNCGKKLPQHMIIPVKREEFEDLWQKNIERFYDKTNFKIEYIMSEKEFYSDMKAFVFAERQCLEWFITDMMDKIYGAKK